MALEYRVEEVSRTSLGDVKERFKDFLYNYRDRRTGLYKYRERLNTMAIMSQYSLVIDFDDLLVHDMDLARIVENYPDIAIEAASQAIKEILLKEHPDYAESIEKFYPRFRGLPRTIPIRRLGSEYIGKMISVEGILVRLTRVEAKMVKAYYIHVDSEDRHGFYWPEFGELGERLEKPIACPICGKSGKFQLDMTLSKYIDWQKIVVQERPEEVPPGQMPRSIEVMLTSDLVDIARPGDRVTVTGILRVMPTASVTRGSGKSVFNLYIDANYVDVQQKVLEEIEITREDEEKIRELARDPWIHEKITLSIAPSIYGHWDIKKAIALALFGGVPKILRDGTRIRGDIHVLLVGDPGIGKSMLLQYAARLAPRAVYTTGKGSSAAGLTAAVLRDKQTGEYYLEAGALVIADGGVAIIDEIDKMRPEDRVAIHEAMEQQSYHKDFEIMLANGTKVRIGELVDELINKYKDNVIQGKDTEILKVNGLKILAYDLKSKKVIPVLVDRISRHRAPEKFVKIIFGNGREIIVTPEHPILIWKDGDIATIRADKLKPGMLAIGVNHIDVIDTDRRILRKILNEFGTDDVILAKLIGFLLSDGYVYSNEENGYYEIGFSSTDRALIEEFKDVIRKIGWKYSIEVQSKNRNKPLVTIRVVSKEVFTKIANIFPEVVVYKTSKTGIRPSRLKRIPRIIFQFSENGIKAFINAFFKGDGFVDKERIGFRASSYDLAQDLQDLLLTMRIYSYIESEERNGRKYYRVVISGTESIKRISEIISDDTRFERIKYLLRRSMNRKNYRDIIPYEIAYTLREIANILHINDGYLTNVVVNRNNIHRLRAKKYLSLAKEIINKMQKAIGKSDIKTLRKVLRLSEFSRLVGIPYSTLRYRLFIKKDPYLIRRFIEEVERRLAYVKERIREIEGIIEGNIRFIPIRSVEIIQNKDSKWVYDVTVEPYHLFVSHGLVLHNSISIAKAGIVARLNARAAVLAAGNPKYGRYDPERTISDNINLPPTILSRFDLIFVMKDIPSPEFDRMMARHILRVHEDVERIHPIIPPDLLRKYISYARRYVTPRLSVEARRILEEFYVQLRRKGGPRSPIPITARQLEALVRLAEAHARMALRNIVTIEDAEEAIRLMSVMLSTVGIDVETGAIDIDTLMLGRPRSQQEKLKIIMETINEMLEASEDGRVSIKELTKALTEKGIPREFIKKTIRKLIREGELYEPEVGYIARV